MMQNLVIFLPLMIFFAGLFYLSRRPQLSSKTDFLSNYFLGDRALKGFVLAMTLVATYGSVSSFVSGPGLAWHYGLGWVVFAA
ncbi:MAG: sodium/panthothenate symporter, partial [Candidatus Aphodousia sp.]|nr:sodium/panthothenate symporter [Candidatus Aphodousia sp.]